ncbi:hypothetical protein [Neotabrizicola sp. VNH66]
MIILDCDGILVDTEIPKNAIASAFGWTDAGGRPDPGGHGTGISMAPEG